VNPVCLQCLPADDLQEDDLQEDDLQEDDLQEDDLQEEGGEEPRRLLAKNPKNPPAFDPFCNVR